MPNVELKGNKGEWSEPYAALKLLSDGKLCQADTSLQALQDYAIVKGVSREDMRAVIIEEEGVVVFTSQDSQATKRVGHDELAGMTRLLFKAIKSGKKVFRVPNVEQFLNECGFTQLKNPVPQDKRSIKRDIQLDVCDQHIGPRVTLGFSIKSYVGSKPSLLNHSDATCLRFRLYGFTDEDMKSVNEINGPTKLRDRCDEIKQRASAVKFDGYHNRTFKNNLELIDGDLPKLISETIYLYYFDHVVPMGKVIERLGLMPEYVDRIPDYCGVKIKRFLRACALGMMPSQPWNDIDEAAGGYVVVQPDGRLVAFYVYNRAMFDDYLVRHTKFDRPSTHKDGKLLHLEVYKKHGKFYVDLRLQIRFK